MLAHRVAIMYSPRVSVSFMRIYTVPLCNFGSRNFARERRASYTVYFRWEKRDCGRNKTERKRNLTLLLSTSSRKRESTRLL